MVLVRCRASWRRLATGSRCGRRRRAGCGGRRRRGTGDRAAVGGGAVIIKPGGGERLDVEGVGGERGDASRGSAVWFGSRPASRHSGPTCVAACGGLSGGGDSTVAWAPPGQLDRVARAVSGMTIGPRLKPRSTRAVEHGDQPIPLTALKSTLRPALMW